MKELLVLFVQIIDYLADVVSLGLLDLLGLFVVESLNAIKEPVLTVYGLLFIEDHILFVDERIVQALFLTFQHLLDFIKLLFYLIIHGLNLQVMVHEHLIIGMLVKRLERPAAINETPCRHHVNGIEMTLSREVQHLFVQDHIDNLMHDVLCLPALQIVILNFFVQFFLDILWEILKDF